MSLYPVVLIAIDLTQSNDEVLRKAKTLSNTLSCDLYLIHVIEFNTNHYFSHESAINKQKILNEASNKVKKKGEQMGVLEAKQFIEVGSPKNTILEKAKAINADLIIIGSHSKKGITTDVGSTAAAIVNSAVCDVMVVYTNKWMGLARAT